MSKYLSHCFLILFDIFSIFLSIVLASSVKTYFYNYPFYEEFNKYNDFIILYIIPVMLFVYHGLYQRRYDFWHETKLVLKSCLLSFSIVFAILAIVKINYSFSRTTIILIFGFMILLVPIFKLFLKKVLFKIGVWKKSAKVLGESADFELEIFRDSYLGYVKSKGKKYDVLVIASGRIGIDNLNDLIDQNIRDNKEILFIPIINFYDFTQAHIYNVFNTRTNLFSIKNSLKSKINLFIKYTIDIFIILIASPFLLSIFAVIIIAIKITEPGSKVFFSHKRMGLHGKLFDCLKFRSMKENSSEILDEYLKNNPQEIEYFKQYHKYQNDPRITKFGQFIRRTSLDEFPQFINVLKGDMSIVGPRPCAEYEKKDMGKYADIILSVRPGITGVWQVSGRSDVDFKTRADMDIWYVKNWCIWNDLVIILKTFKVIFSRKGAV